jgi:TetR/AcrR family tetracycline transcriptional repressor
MPRSGSARPPRTRGPGERAGLSAASILAAARTLAETEGVGALSMRSLAERLGVAANALYSYFPDKAALLDGLLDHLLGDIPRPEARPSDWRGRLAGILRSTRALLLRHPDLIPLFLARPGRGPNAMRLGNDMLEALATAGLAGKMAAQALRILLIYALGFAAHEAPRRMDPAGPQRIRESERAFSGAEHLPRMRQLSGELAQHADDQTFETGLRWLLSSIAREAESQR